MPEKMHRALVEEGRKRGYTGERLKRFVYGIMAKREKERKNKEKPG